MTFVGGTKHGTSFTNGTKTLSTFRKWFRHGKIPTMVDLADLLFTDTLYIGSTTELKDYTFDTLSDASFTNGTKH